MTGKLGVEEKEKISEVAEEKIAWLRENGDDATAEELKVQKKEVEDVSQPIIAGVYKDKDKEPRTEDEL